MRFQLVEGTADEDRFVSGVSCPWCAIGLQSLETALERIGEGVRAELHFQPFELNAQMPLEGQDIVEHLGQKYGVTPEQTRRNQDAIRQRGAAVGFTFEMDKRTRVYNTFDSFGARCDRRRQALDPGRPSTRGLRTGIAADRRGGLTASGPKGCRAERCLCAPWLSLYSGAPEKDDGSLTREFISRRRPRAGAVHRHTSRGDASRQRCPAA